MLINKLSDFNELDYVNLSKAIHFLNSTDLAQTPLGRSHQRDESFYCQTLEYMTEDIDDFNFEIHQRRLDLHYVVEGEEEIDVSIDAHPNYLVNIILIEIYST
ncbi:YhcH/YjgK/YiaL family protein [Oenococcus oeni]|nr:YhcH/YjgK/YiaL family protein [Oenococcus oeni]